MSDKLHALARIFRLFRLLCALFFPLLAIVPALGFFCRSRKALHCNWRAFSIVDRLYFLEIFWSTVNLQIASICRCAKISLSLDSSSILRKQEGPHRRRCIHPGVSCVHAY